jgi:23S rRNA (cytidine1920-2'-O)/16S rRNA (cytidine1409-2'-O)-methyltransferase
MVRRGLAVSPGEARDKIVAGDVTVGGRPVHKPESLVAEDDAVAVSGPARRFVSRGGEKHAPAQEPLGLDP